LKGTERKVAQATFPNFSRDFEGPLLTFKIGESC
jgi:hypothetical protein